MIRWMSAFFLLLLPLLAQTQDGTTLEEYRYMTKGYAYQLEMGLDAHKEGYEIRKLYRSEQGTQFVGLYRRGEQQLRALLAIIDADSPKAKYLCIPNLRGSKEIKEQYRQQKQQVLVGYTARQQFEESLTALLLQSLDEPMPSAPWTAAPQPQRPVVEPAEEIELTSRGIPINTKRYPSPPAQKPLEREVPTEMNHLSEQKSNAINAKVDAKIGGLLSNRILIEAPKVTRKHAGKGQVVIKICVSANGDVTRAKFTQRGSTTFNESLKALALESARQTRFSRNNTAEQCGTIAYHFK